MRITEKGISKTYSPSASHALLRNTLLAQRMFCRAKHTRGVSSAGRAPALQAGGHRFDPDTLHQAFPAQRLTQFDHQAFVECLVIQLDGVARNWLRQSLSQLGELLCNSPKLTSFREIHISFMLNLAVRMVLRNDLRIRREA